MEESGSDGLDELIVSETKKGKDGYFDGVDCVCIVRFIPSIRLSFTNQDSSLITIG